MATHPGKDNGTWQPEGAGGEILSEVPALPEKWWVTSESQSNPLSPTSFCYGFPGLIYLVLFFCCHLVFFLQFLLLPEKRDSVTQGLCPSSNLGIPSGIIGSCPQKANMEETQGNREPSADSVIKSTWNT